MHAPGRANLSQAHDTTGRSTIEIRSLSSDARIGTEFPGEAAPEAHRLDRMLWIDPSRVQIGQDGMAHVFDDDLPVRFPVCQEPRRSSCALNPSVPSSEHGRDKLAFRCRSERG